jgi:hypothetical protein
MPGVAIEDPWQLVYLWSDQRHPLGTRLADTTDFADV